MSKMTDIALAYLLPVLGVGRYKVQYAKHDTTIVSLLRNKVSIPLLPYR